MGWDASACFITGSLARGFADQGVHSTCRVRGKMFPWFQMFLHILGCQNVSSSRPCSPLQCLHSITCVPICVWMTRFVFSFRSSWCFYEFHECAICFAFHQYIHSSWALSFQFPTAFWQNSTPPRPTVIIYVYKSCWSHKTYCWLDLSFQPVSNFLSCSPVWCLVLFLACHLQCLSHEHGMLFELECRVDESWLGGGICLGMCMQRQ